MIFRGVKEDPKTVQNHAKAMRLLGLYENRMDKNKEVKVVTVNQFSEDDIILAFQTQCSELGEKYDFK